MHRLAGPLQVRISDKWSANIGIVEWAGAWKARGVIRDALSVWTKK
jgi:hypothetical protein